MAIQIPNIGIDFKDQVKNATEKSIEMLRSKCMDGIIYRSEFELEIQSIFREFNLEPEDSDFDNIEIALDSLNCSIQEKFMTFDKFLLITEGTWELPDTLEKAKMLNNICDKLKNDPTYSLSLAGHANNKEGDLYDCFGDDGLFDIIGNMQDNGTYSNEKALKAIRDSISYYLKEYKKDPSGFRNILKPEVEEILVKI